MGILMVDMEQYSCIIAHDEGDDNTFPQSVSRKERLTCDILLELLGSCLHRNSTA